MATMTQTPKEITPVEILRIGNPWMIGANAGRIAPLYVLHNVITGRYRGHLSPRVPRLKDLAFDAATAFSEPDHAKSIDQAFSVISSEYDLLQRTVFGLGAPERRIFRDRKNNGADNSGRLFPFVFELAETTGSDDSLGLRLRALIDSVDPGVQQRIFHLINNSETTNDPCTNFMRAVIGSSGATATSAVVPPPAANDAGRASLARAEFDEHCVKFIANLLDNGSSGERNSSIRRLAWGCYFIAIMQLVTGPSVRLAGHAGELPLVMAFGDLPPGATSDPSAELASNSFVAWANASYRATAGMMARQFERVTVVGHQTAPRLQQLRDALAWDSSGNARKPQILACGRLDRLSSIPEAMTTTIDWCHAIMEHNELAFGAAEWRRRLRVLCNKIGFAAPERGATTKLVVDTPLLEVIVSGIAGSTTMTFEQFVDALASRFGLVVGPGSDGALADRLKQSIGDPGDTEHTLRSNEDQLRRRLLRVGLARAHSDSHTTVAGADFEGASNV